MSVIVKHIPHTVDLNEPVKKVYIDTLLATEDNLAHCFDITLVQGVPSDAAVTAYFIRYSDNVTVTIKNGAVNGNVASVTLSKICYNKPGQFAIIIKVTADGVTNTVFYGEGTIFASTTDIIVDEENVIPSLADLLAQISAMETATANAKAEAANAKEQAQEAEEATKAISGWVNATATARSVDPDEEANVNLSTDENGNLMEFMIPRGQPGVQVSSDEPTNPNVTVWIKPDGMVDENGNVVDLAPVYSEIDELKDVKASVIMDASPKAASHELHAQDGKLGVTLYGNTIETGTGDKSPDNPYVISGVDAAEIRAGGKNLADLPGTFTGQGYAFNKLQLPTLCAGDYTFSFVSTVEKVTCELIIHYTDGSKLSRWPVTVIGKTVNKFTAAKPFNMISLYINAGSVEAQTYTDFTLNAGSEVLPCESYNANTIDMPLLPNGAPLMGSGTVMDTIEIDVLSGCDKCVVFDGSDDENWFSDAASVRRAFRINGGLPQREYKSNNDVYCLYTNALPTESKSNTTFMGIGESCRSTEYSGDFITLYPVSVFADVNAFKAYLAANPLKVYYRSTEYTPEKDLRVCKTVRKHRTITLDGVTNKVIVGSAGVYKTLGDSKKVDNAPFVSSHFNKSYKATAGGCYISTTQLLLLGVIGDIAGTQYESIYPDGDLTDKSAKFNTWLQDQVSAGKPVTFSYELDTPEVYYTDPLPLRKPSGIMPVTVTGSGETSVEYPHDTKHYIDQKFEALAAALLS